MKRRLLYGLLAVAASLCIGYAVLVCVLTYTAPNIIRAKANVWATSIGRQLVIDTVEFSPLTWSINVTGLRLFDSDRSVLFSAKRLSFDVVPYALIFGQWRSHAVLLEAPHFALVQAQDGQWNGLHLINDLSKRYLLYGQAPADIFLDELTIKGASISLQPLAGGAAPAWTIRALDLNLVNVSTVTSRTGSYSLEAKTNEGARFTWYGKLSLQPFDSFGEARIENISVAYLKPYLPFFPPGLKVGGKLTLGTTYHIALGRPTVKLTLSPLYVTWEQAHIEMAQGKTSLQLQALYLDDGIFDLGKRALFFKRARLKKPRVALCTEGSFTLPLGSSLTKVFALQNRSPWLAGWSLHINHISLDGGHLALVQEGVNRPFHLQTQIARASAKLQVTPHGGVHLTQIQAQLTTFVLQQAKSAFPSVQVRGLSITNSHFTPKLASLGSVSLIGMQLMVNRAHLATLKHSSFNNPKEGWGLPPKLMSYFAPLFTFLSKVQITEIAIVDGSAYWVDGTLARPVAVSFTSITGQIMRAAGNGHFAYCLQGRMQSGKIGLEGIVVPTKGVVRASVKLSTLPLRPFAPYFLPDTSFDWEQGSVSSELLIVYHANKNQAYIEGSTTLADIELTIHSALQPKLTINALKLVGIRLHSSLRAVKVAEARVESPILQLRAGPRHTSAVAEESLTFLAPIFARLPKIDLFKLRLTQGVINFTDSTVRPKLAVRVDHLHAAVDNATSTPTQKATMRLQGNIGGMGELRLVGHSSVEGLNKGWRIQLALKRFPISLLNAYFVEIFGWHANAGSLVFEADYYVALPKFYGTQRVTLRSLALNASAPVRPQRAMSLPLVLGLMDDKVNGIEFNTTISGAIDDPMFSLRDALWHPLRAQIGTLGSDPLAALARQFGNAPISPPTFSAGENRLVKHEQLKMQTLGAWLCQRPRLAVEITGSYDPRHDVPALARQRVDATIAAMTDMLPVAQQLDLLDTRIQSAFEHLFRQRFGLVAYWARRLWLVGASQKVWVQQLRNELIAHELSQIDHSALSALGEDRAQEAKHYLKQGCPTLSARLYPSSVVQQQATDQGMPLVLKLMLADVAVFPLPGVSPPS